MRRLSFIAFFLSLLTACSGGPQPADRAGHAPALVLERFLDGKTYAYGVFERGGVLARKFRVEIDGHWDGETLELDEHFVYDDGQTQQRVWQLRRTAPGRFSGTAGDVVDTAQVETHGDAAFFGYRVDLALSDGSTVRVRFDDRLYAVADDVVFNRATVSKFGITVGEVTLVFLKQRPADWAPIPGA